VNDKWEELFKTHSQHLSKTASDHSPLIVDIEPQLKMGRKPFKFLNIWCEHEQFMGVVKEAWEVRVEGNAMYRFKTVTPRFSKLTFITIRNNTSAEAYILQQKTGCYRHT